MALAGSCSARREERLLIVALVVLLASFALRAQRPTVQPSPANAPAVVAELGRLLLSFVPNAGEIDPEVRFVLRVATWG